MNSSTRSETSPYGRIFVEAVSFVGGFLTVEVKTGAAAGVTGTEETEAAADKVGAGVRRELDTDAGKSALMLWYWTLALLDVDSRRDGQW